MITLFVPGIPASQGSIRPVGVNKYGKTVMVSTSKKLKPWRAKVAKEAKRAIGEITPMAGPVTVNLRFVFEAPFSRARRPFEVAGWMPHAVSPDLDKLVRAAGDAISVNVDRAAPLIKDDSLIWQFGSIEAIERPNSAWPTKYPHNPYKPGLYIELCETDVTMLAPLKVDEFAVSRLGQDAFFLENNDVKVGV